MQVHRHLPLPPALGLVPGASRRAWSVLLVVALALASFLHVAHSHEADAPSYYKQHCTYCSTLDRGGAPPPASFAALPLAPAPSLPIAAPTAPPAATGWHPAGRPRAPPSFEA